MNYINPYFMIILSKHIITIFVVIALLFFSNFCIYGQDRNICLINKLTGKEVIIKEGKRISICQFNEKIKGKFSILSDSTILIKKDTLKISKIIEIRRKPVFTRIIGSTVIVIIGVPTLYAITIFTIVGLTRGFHGDAGMALIAIPIALVGAIGELGGALTYRFEKKYNIEKWDIEIKNKTSPNLDHIP